MRVCEVEAVTTYPLRSTVLRNWSAHTACPFKDDTLKSTRHFAVYIQDEKALSVASFFDVANNLVHGATQVQLRGMATHPDFRGMGLGKALMLEVLSLYSKAGYNSIWCNAREIAKGFYAKLNFVEIGNAFEIEGIGKHCIMWKPLC